jgi:lipopolysaccharide export LptBFGC system permease protein LptF
MSKDAVALDAYWPRGEQALEASPPSQVRTRPFLEMTTSELRRHARPGMPNWIEGRIELNKRFALPLACVMLALVGIPLGVSSRKGGKSTGYVWGVFLAFFCYHLSFISLVGLAKQRTIPPEIAVWTPNAAFALAGLILLARMERAGGRHDVFGAIAAWLGALAAGVRQRFGGLQPRAANHHGGLFKTHLPVLPQIVDTYILSNFLFYFAVMLASFVSMTEIYNFFELLGDMVRNNIPLSKVFTYLAFLTPKLVYDTLPISVLVAVLVTFAVLTKQRSEDLYTHVFKKRSTRIQK